MFAQDEPSKSFPNDGLHDWARLESRTDAMAEELWQQTQTDAAPSHHGRLAIACGVTIYIALTIGLATLFFAFDAPTPPPFADPPQRHAFVGPKF